MVILALDDVLKELINPSGFIAYMSRTGNAISYIYSAGFGAFDLQNYFTIGTKTLSYSDAHYSATEEATHTFVATDNITVKRTLERLFTQVFWLIHGAAYAGVTENMNVNNTLTIPASALHCGKNSIVMSVRYSGASVDSIYTGYVWMDNPAMAALITAAGTTVCSGTKAVLIASATSVTNPVFRWYASQTATEILHTGANYETPALTATATYYISVLGNGICENKPDERKAVTVTVSPCVVPVNPTSGRGFIEPCSH